MSMPVLYEAMPTEIYWGLYASVRARPYKCMCNYIKYSGPKQFRIHHVYHPSPSERRRINILPSYPECSKFVKNGKQFVPVIKLVTLQLQCHAATCINVAKSATNPLLELLSSKVHIKAVYLMVQIKQ